jgi:hypothetical protein
VMIFSPGTPPIWTQGWLAGEEDLGFRVLEEGPNEQAGRRLYKRWRILLLLPHFGNCSPDVSVH